MKLFQQTCSNLRLSQISFSPSLKQVHFLPIPSMGQETQVNGYIVQPEPALNGWVLPLPSQEAGFLSSVQCCFSLLLQEFKPSVKLVQNSQIRRAVRGDLLRGEEEED